MYVTLLVTYKSLLLAMMTQLHFKVYGINLEISEGSKGYHLYIFLFKPRLNPFKVLEDWNNNYNYPLLRSYVFTLLEKRLYYKKIKDYQKADEIRMAFKKGNVKIIDTVDGYRLEEIYK